MRRREGGLNFRFSDSILIASEHNENFPDKDWTGTSIRRKFAQLHKVKIPTGDLTCPAEVRYAKQVFRKIEERADAGGVVDSTDLGMIEDGNNVEDEFMVLEDSQENAEAVETSDSTPAVSAGATVAIYASARFPCSMVFPRLRDKAMSNSLDKILALVSTQLLQKADKNDDIPMQMQMQQQHQQQQNMMNMMMMAIMSSILTMGHHKQPPQLPLSNPFRP